MDGPKDDQFDLEAWITMPRKLKRAWQGKPVPLLQEQVCFIVVAGLAGGISAETLNILG